VLADPFTRQHVVPEGERRTRQLGLWILDQQAPLLEQQLKAVGVGDQRVDADVQAAGFFVQPTAPDLEQRPAVGREDLMRHARARGRESAHLLLGRCVAEVVDRQPVRRQGIIGQDLLKPVGPHDRAQHLVPTDQLPQRLLGLLRTQLRFLLGLLQTQLRFLLRLLRTQLRLLLDLLRFLLDLLRTQQIFLLRQLRVQALRLGLRLTAGQLQVLLQRRNLLLDRPDSLEQWL